MGGVYVLLALPEAVGKSKDLFSMYYEDLTFYEYYLPFKIRNVLNVGWLDKDVDFHKGEVPFELVEKLHKILVEDGAFRARVNQIRGMHPCCLCGALEFDSPFIGSCELWIPAKDKDAYFAAPSMIVHYIKEHGYCPPKEFVEAVLGEDFDSAFNGQEVYDFIVENHLNIE